MFRKKRIILYYFAFSDLFYTPVDIGYIIAIIKKRIGNKYKFDLVEHSLSRKASEEEIDKIIAQEIDDVSGHDPQAVFFFVDNIVWSKLHAVGRSLKIAMKMKEKHPGIFVGIQSYKFSNSHARDLFHSGSVDALIGNDPEHSFIFIGEMLRKKNVPGVIYEYDKEKISQFISYSGPHVEIGDRNLDEIPSPYLEHVFDGLLSSQAKEKNKFTALLYSSRGCKFGCYYCARSVKFEKLCFFSAKRFYDEIEYIYTSFGIIRYFVLDDALLFSSDRLRDFIFEFEQRKLRFPDLEKIRLFIMARIETLDEKMILSLKKINVVWVQIGLQTVNPELQGYMNRRVPIRKFQEISSLLRKYGIKLFLDVIIGLPGDSIEYLKETIDFAIDLKPRTIQAKQLYLNPGTLFDIEREYYGIKAESGIKDYYAPYVYEAAGGVNNGYHREAYRYFIEKIEQHPEIAWRFLTQSGAYFSPGVGRLMF